MTAIENRAFSKGARKFGKDVTRLIDSYIKIWEDTGDKQADVIINAFGVLKVRLIKEMKDYE